MCCIRSPDSDEQAAIAEMYRLLKPGGYALVNVAAMPMLRGDHSVLSREVRRYSRGDLRIRLEQAGFAIGRLTYTNATLFPPLALARLLQRRRGLRAEGETAAEISVPPAPINALMTAVMHLEALWLRAFDAPFGSSLLCLARKPVVNRHPEDPQPQMPAVRAAPAPLRRRVDLIGLEHDREPRRRASAGRSRSRRSGRVVSTTRPPDRTISVEGPEK